MLRYSKLNSKQAGAFTTPSNRMIDIEIPEGMVCNLGESFIQLLLHLDTTAPVVRNFILKSTTATLTPMNIDLIRNCSLVGSKVGKLEDIRRVNVLKHNLNTMMKSSQEKLSSVDTLFQQFDLYSNQNFSLFVDFVKEGTTASKYRDISIRIPLKELFELGSQVIDTKKTGSLTIHLELENLSYLSFERVNLFNDVDEGKCENITTGSDLTKLKTKMKYPNLELTPFFVGQQLTITATAGTGAPSPAPAITSPVIINSITRNSDLSLTLGITPALPNNVTTPFTWVTPTLSEITTTTTQTLTVETCELGLCEVVGGKQEVNEMEYFTWTTEEYSSGGVKSMNKIFEVEPEAVNAFLMFDTNSSNFISNNVGVTSYRMRVDNNDVYNRDILVNKSSSKESYIHDALHYDSVYRTFLNAGYSLKDMSFLGLARNQETYVNKFSQADQQIMLCCAPMPLTQGSKKLQFNVVAEKESGSKVENVILYKQVLKSMKL